MGRCDLYTSCSEFFVYIFIGDHRNLSVCERKLQHLADEILVALIFRIYGNSSITQQVSGRVVAISTKRPSSPTIG